MTKVDDNAHVWDGEETAVYQGPLNPEFPEGLAAPGPSFNDVGWLDDGDTEIDRAESYTDLTVQGGKLLRTKVKSIKNTIKILCTEENATTVLLQYPDAVLTTDANGVVTLSTAGGSKKAESSWIIDFFDGDYRKRYIIPRGEVTGRSKLAHGSEKWTVYEFTISIYGSFEIIFSKLDGAPVATP